MTDYNEDGSVVDWTDYAQLKAQAKIIGRPVEMMIALSWSNDPFSRRLQTPLRASRARE